MPVILIIAIIFLYYVLSTVEPEDITYAITNNGVKIADKTTEWEAITNFWFTNRLNTELLVLGVLFLPGRLEFVVSGKDKDQIRKIIADYVPEEESPPSGIDKAANWLSNKLPS